MDFDILITNFGKCYSLSVKQINVTSISEDIVISSASGVKSVTVQSNRPMLRGKKLKTKPPAWKLVDGVINQPKEFEKVIKKIFFALDTGIIPAPVPLVAPTMSLIEMISRRSAKREKGDSGASWADRRS